MSDLLNILRSGDVITLQGCTRAKNFGAFMSNFFWWISYPAAVAAIEDVSKMVFGQVMDPNKIRDRDNHATMFFDPTHVFSCEPPHPTYIPLTEYDVDDKYRIVSVYRMNPAFWGFTPGPKELALLKEGADMIINWRDAKGNPLTYDTLQNLDIGVNAIMGHPYTDEVHIFDADGNDFDAGDINIAKGKQHMVCSVAVAGIIRHMRYVLNNGNPGPILDPWSKLNPQAWKKSFYDNYPKHWDTESVFPSSFAVTDTHFQNEFLFMGSFKNGAKIA
jgi:hypothetical protein